jgi:hypothetical protein
MFWFYIYLIQYQLFLLFLNRYDASSPRELLLASRGLEPEVFFSAPEAAFRSRPTTGIVAFLPVNTPWLAASYAIKLPFGECIFLCSAILLKPFLNPVSSLPTPVSNLEIVVIFLVLVLLMGFMLPRLAAIESFTFIFNFFYGYLSVA